MGSAGWKNECERAAGARSVSHDTPSYWLQGACDRENAHESHPDRVSFDVARTMLVFMQVISGTKPRQIMSSNLVLTFQIVTKWVGIKGKRGRESDAKPLAGGSAPGRTARRGIVTVEREQFSEITGRL